MSATGPFACTRLFAQMAPVPLVLAQARFIPGWPSLEAQEALFRQMFELDVLVKWPVDGEYVGTVVSRLCKALSTEEEGIHDLLACKLVEIVKGRDESAVVTEGDAGYCYVTYWMNDCPVPYTIRTTRRVDKIGQRIWPATFHLIHYFQHHPEVLRGKHVLELGSGTGLAAFALCCSSSSSTCTDSDITTHFTLTEYPGEPLDNLSHCCDIYKASHASTCRNSCNVCVAGLDWYDPCNTVIWDETGVAGFAKVDVVVGSDLIYDPANHVPLVNTLSAIFEARRSTTSDGDASTLPVVAYLACTIRNPATFEEFVSVATAAGMSVNMLWSIDAGDETVTAPDVFSHVVNDDVCVRSDVVAKHMACVVGIKQQK